MADQKRESKSSLEDFEKLLELAEKLQHEREEQRILEDTYRARVYLALTMTLGIVSVLLALIGWSGRSISGSDLGTTLATFTLLIVVALSGALFLYSNSIRRTIVAKREFLAREHALYETVQILREAEHAYAENWSTLERAQFRIRLARFDIGSDEPEYRRKI